MTPDSFGTEDVHYFIDFTMGVLGSSPDDYKQYTVKIQAEYSHLSSASYAQLRLKVNLYSLR